VVLERNVESMTLVLRVKDDQTKPLLSAMLTLKSSKVIHSVARCLKSLAESQRLVPNVHPLDVHPALPGAHLFGTGRPRDDLHTRIMAFS
jgi:hypothetical protein